MTPGTPLARLCPEGFRHRPGRKTNPEGPAGRKDRRSVAIARNCRPRFNSTMPELTRRRSPDAREECWHVYYGDVHAGTIAIRTGIPHDEDPWGWDCCFYPGSHPGFTQAGADLFA
jgi:hypothetical protein